MRPADTTPEAWSSFLDAMRKMSPEEKLARTFELSDEVRQRAEAAIRARYPNANDREVLLRWARTTLGEDLFARAYGDALPDDHDPAAFDMEQLQDEVFRLSVHRLLAEIRAE